MGETNIEGAQLDEILYLENSRRMIEKVKGLVGEYPLHNDVCHRKAVSLGKKLVAEITPEQ